jgi:heme A synthase
MADPTATDERRDERQGWGAVFFLIAVVLVLALGIGLVGIEVALVAAIVLTPVAFVVMLMITTAPDSE